MRDLIPVSELQTNSAPFKDPNFKLAVLNALMWAKVLQFGDFTDFLKHVEGPDYDYEEDGYRPSEKAYDYFSRYPLSDEQIASVSELYFDGGLDIYQYVYPFWGGETASYDIQSLADISLLPNLKRFSFSAMLASTDLSPLEGHPNIEMLELGLTGTWQNFEVVETLPKLRHLQVFGHDLNAASEAVILRLAGRGIITQVF